MEFWKQCLLEETGKTSIKRVMLMVWFIFMLVFPFVGSGLEMIHLYIFAVLMGSKTVESVAQYKAK